MKTTDIAWFAGLFEGEGCIYTPKGRHGVAIAIKMTDRDVIKRVHSMFPNGNFHEVPQKQAHHKMQYEWRTGKSKEIVRILNLILPHLGERRTAKALELIAYIETMPGKGTFNAEKTHCPYGHKYTPKNTKIIIKPDGKKARVCRICLNEYRKSWREEKKANGETAS